MKGKKRPNVFSALGILGPKSRLNPTEEMQVSSGSSGSVQAPFCRPWDRDDLFRRLSTFKSMTWFAKPQVQISEPALCNGNCFFFFFGWLVLNCKN